MRGDIVKIGEVCTIAPPKSEVKNYRLGGNDKVSFLPMEDLGVDIKSIIPNKERTLEEVAGSYTYFAEGDILLAKVTPCFENGKLGIASCLKNGIGFGSSEFIVLRPNVKKVIPTYLYYRLQDSSFRKEGRSLMVGACGLKRLPKSYVAESPIYLPTLSAQQRIVDILDVEFAKIDTLKTNAERNLQNAKELFKTAVGKELSAKKGWKKYTLQDACLEYGQYGMSVPSKPYNGVRYLRITDITEDGNLNNDRVSAKTDYIIEEKYYLKRGDVLFARTGATVGKTLVYEPEMGECSYAGYLIRYRPNTNIVLPRTLYYITHSLPYYEWVLKVQKQAVLPNISAKLYNDYTFSVPNIAEQRSIIATLDGLNTKCRVLQDNYTKTIALCADLKQSLLRKAFNGEL